MAERFIDVRFHSRGQRAALGDASAQRSAEAAVERMTLRQPFAHAPLYFIDGDLA